MGAALQARWSLALLGALGGALIWALGEAVPRGILDDRLALALHAAVASFVLAALAMAGPMGLARAAARALGPGVLTGGLVGLVALRFASAEEVFAVPMHLLAALTVASLPVPFLIAAARPGWRDYPALFEEAWSIVIRLAAALAFTLLVWILVLLSDQVLRIVGIGLLSQLLESRLAVRTLVGATLGLGMAVVWELAGPIAPQLVLRLLRLLLPVVLAVMLVFLLALSLRGFERLVLGLSRAGLLLSMVAAGVALVAVAVDRSDAEAAQGRAIRWAALGMALVLPLVAGLALWALWLRVGQYGWTPERLFLALGALIGLGYGLTYAIAVLRGAGWMARIRRGNVGMALAVIAAAALWLTPLFNAEAIAARSQVERFLAGRTGVADLDLWAFRRWGRPGAAALARLEKLAAEPGNEALAARLRGDDDPLGTERAEALAGLTAILPLQPPTATGTRDMILAAAEPYRLRDWAGVCARKLETGQPACVMVVADLLPAIPGEEAILVLERSSGAAEAIGLYPNADGYLTERPVARPDQGYLPGEAAAELLRAAQAAPLALTPAEINQLGTGATGVLILP
ncbi:DUF4153 domain-containing protein [Tabrizicola sp.]|uniref:DUF4153 domain-containing protein n=1 Tax=Tabrizicola sp. TaxID=2005166 RepID=UPI0035B2CE8F